MHDLPSEKYDCDVEGLKYVSGFLAYKFKTDYPELGKHTYAPSVYDKTVSPWIRALSHGCLIEPSQEFFDTVSQFEKVFLSFHGDKVNNCENVMLTLQSLLSNQFPNIPVPIIAAYVKTRTHIKVKFLNNILKVQTHNLTARNKWKVHHFQH